MAENPLRMVCEHCGSEDVTRDAWASWDIHTQDWALGAIFDYAYCHKCQDSTYIEERP
jgi:hypothetical protein